MRRIFPSWLEEPRSPDRPKTSLISSMMRVGFSASLNLARSAYDVGSAVHPLLASIITMSSPVVLPDSFSSLVNSSSQTVENESRVWETAQARVSASSCSSVAYRIDAANALASSRTIAPVMPGGSGCGVSGSCFGAACFPFCSARCAASWTRSIVRIAP